MVLEKNGTEILLHGVQAGIVVPSEAAKKIALRPLGKCVVELDEDFLVNLSNATNATISDNQGTGTIQSLWLTFPGWFWAHWCSPRSWERSRS